ncbi:MAG: DsbA family oxidoreductase [Magnetovibrio sp.]|nr:DsbA family oxidoreductase [Magnetovibrio sp.]
MNIDVCIDLICPWCYIGKRRLQRALGLRPALQAHLKWQPFMLNPTMPETGMDRKGYLLNKFGTESRVRRLLGALEVTGQSEEINFNFDTIENTPNTRNAHRLVRYADAFGQSEPVVEALFRAYFVEGQDIGDMGVLCAVGGSVGLVQKDLEGYLESSQDVAWVDQQNAITHQLGINGVPCYVINGEMALQGAQPAEVLARLLDAAAA